MGGNVKIEKVSRSVLLDNRTLLNGRFETIWRVGIKLQCKPSSMWEDDQAAFSVGGFDQRKSVCSLEEDVGC